MKRMEVAKWLKGITIILGLMGAVFFFLILPMMAGEMKTAYPEVAFLYWPGMCYGWLIGVLCYLCLYQFWKVCTEIGRDNSFSKENAKSFVVISRLTLIIAAIFFAGVLFLAVNRWLNPGIMIFMLKECCTSL